MNNKLAEDIFRALDINDLNSDEQLIYEELGIEVLKRMSELSGGQSFHVKKPASFKRTLRRVLREKIKTTTIKQLSREYELAPTYIRKLLNIKSEPKC